MMQLTLLLLMSRVSFKMGNGITCINLGATQSNFHHSSWAMVLVACSVILEGKVILSLFSSVDYQVAASEFWCFRINPISFVVGC